MDRQPANQDVLGCQTCGIHMYTPREISHCLHGHETRRVTTTGTHDTLNLQHEEGRERWRSRLERLQEECSGERKTAREAVSRLSGRAEDAEDAARRAAGAVQEESAGLRALLSAEFAEVCLSCVFVLFTLLGYVPPSPDFFPSVRFCGLCVSLPLSSSCRWSFPC